MPDAASAVPPPPARAARSLEAALLFTLVAHGAAMASMALFLLPGIPGGSSVTLAARAAYVAAHPWLWRAGWLGWQVTALSDLLLAAALLATPWIPRRPATLVLLVTLAGLVPDQYGQAMWTWPGVAVARDVVARNEYAPYHAFEARAFVLIAGWGTIGYLAAALGWTWCFAAVGTWSRALTRLSVAVWALFAATIPVLFLPESVAARPALRLGVSAANGVAFVLLMLWLAAVAERVFRRARPTTPHGSHAPWRHPSQRRWARAIDLLANSRLARAVGERLPIFSMASDITDVVYVNYLVPVERIAPLLPPYLELQTLGPGGTFSLFTFLTYRHGHFGPVVFGPLRRLWPSPVQSNWRLYVRDPQTGREGVHFVTTTITSTPHALATRLLSEGVPMHVPASAAVARDPDDGTVRAAIDPGPGTAPDLQITARPAQDRTLPSDWQACFASYDQMLAFCVPQDRALAPQPWYARVARQEIALGIPPAACQPLDADVESRAGRALVGDARPLCFLVDRVAFRFAGESFDLRR